MEDLRPPFRQQFDSARDPYTARNALGITSLGGGGGGGYIVSVSPPLAVSGGGNLTVDLSAYLTSATAAATYQPLDGDLTAIAALTGTNVIYYRSAADTWAAVTIGANLTFAGGTLSAAGGGSGSPGGSTTQVQFNDAGAFGGDADLTWNKTTNLLTVNGNISVTGGVGNSIKTNSVIEASTFRCTGTVAILGSELTNGIINLRPNGIASTTGQLQVSAALGVLASTPVTLPADPTTALQAATKQYVDNSLVGMDCGLLTLVSATQLKFAPFKGDRIRIAGVVYAIPSAGIAGLTNGGLSAGTTYYAYAYNNSGTITGEFSTTAHATSTTAANVGTEIKSGDNTRTLIGIVRANASAQFVDSAAERLVRSWFNRGQQSATAVASGSTTSTSFVQGTGVGYILSWAGETVTYGFTGSVSASAATSVSNSAGLDQIANLTCVNYLPIASSAGASLSTAAMPTEGLHYVACGIASGAGAVTASINSGSAVWITVA